MRKLAAIGFAIGIWMAPYQAAAAKYDGSVPLLCAPIQIIECEAAGDCYNSTAESVNIPQFLKIDFKKKMISAAEEAGRKVAIKLFEHNNGRMIMHGGQEGRGWTMVISEETGKMSATVSEDQVGFILFGACTPQ
jgi:hypothetical protein